MNRLISLTVSILVVFMLTGCGDSGKEDSKTTVLEGSWAESSFHFAGNGDDDTPGNADDEWEKYSAEINGDTLVYEGEVAYGATEPTVPAFGLTLTMSFKIGDDAATPAGATNIDYVQISYTFTLFTQETVDDWNGGEIYGYTDWELNVAKDVSGRILYDGEAAEDTNGTKSYGIFQIKDDGKLYVDDDEADVNYDGSTEAKRVRALTAYGLTKID